MTDKETQQETSSRDLVLDSDSSSSSSSEPIDLASDSSSLEPINIVSEEDGVSISPEEKRKTFRLNMAGGLAGILWLSLLLVILYHCVSTFWFSNKLSQLKAEEKSSFIEEAIQANHETAQSIYTFLTPLAAAVTAFFFDANGFNRNND